jgi:hypothetical protein
VHPPVELLIREKPALSGVIQPAVDFLAKVDVVLNVVEAGVVRKLIKNVTDFIFCVLHRLSPYVRPD